MISFGGLSDASGETLSRIYGWYEEAAREAGQTVSRDQWRLGLPFHLAETRERAIEEARAGYEHELVHYYGEVLGSGVEPEAATLEAGIEQGGILVGTPDDAVDAIERLLAITGGFGGFLSRAHEWTTWEQTVHSYELFSRYVIPHFRGQLASKQASREWVASTPDAKIVARPCRRHSTTRASSRRLRRSRRRRGGARKGSRPCRSGPVRGSRAWRGRGRGRRRSRGARA